MPIIINGKIAHFYNNNYYDNCDRIIYVPAGTRVKSIEELKNKIRTNEVYEVDKVYCVPQNGTVSTETIDIYKSWYMFDQINNQSLTGNNTGPYVKFKLDETKKILGYSCYTTFNNLTSVNQSRFFWYDPNHKASRDDNNYKLMYNAELSPNVDNTKYKTANGENLYKFTYNFPEAIELSAGKYLATLDINGNTSKSFGNDPEVTDFVGGTMRSSLYQNLTIGSYLNTSFLTPLSDKGNILFTLNYVPDIKYDPVELGFINVVYDDTRKKLTWNITYEDQDVSMLTTGYNIILKDSTGSVLYSGFTTNNYFIVNTDIYGAGYYYFDVQAKSNEGHFSKIFELPFELTESPVVDIYSELNNTTDIWIKYVPKTDITMTSFTCYLNNNVATINVFAIVLNSAGQRLFANQGIIDYTNVTLETNDGYIAAKEAVAKITDGIQLRAGETYWFSMLLTKGDYKFIKINDKIGEYAEYIGDKQQLSTKTNFSANIGTLHNDVKVYLKVN